MFGKLLKYDFRSMLKQFAFLWPAALLLALVNRFTLDTFLTSTNTAGETVSGIAMLVYIAILMAMFIIALVFTIQRFYKGLLGDEGYLMHTLPVRPWQLIGSKLLCAVITTFLSVVVAILSVLLIIPWEAEDFRELFNAFRYLFSHWNLQASHGVLALLESILFMLASFATGYLQLYLAMGIGHLFNKNRVACSVVAYIALNVIMNAVVFNLLNPLSDWIGTMLTGMRGIAGFHSAVWLGIAGELVLSVIYFAGTEFILRKKLNLE